MTAPVLTLTAPHVQGAGDEPVPIRRVYNPWRRHTRRERRRIEREQQRAAIRAGRHGVTPHRLALSDVQCAVMDDPARFRVVIAGRRVGKTFMLVLATFLAAAAAPGRVAWFVAPTFGWARDYAWELLLNQIIPPSWIDKTWQSRLTVRLRNGSVIQMKGAEKPQRLRGRALDFVALDEFTLMKKEAWTEVLRPSLADRGGAALFGGTPMGFNWGYDLFADARSGKAGDDWSAHQYTTEEGGFVPPEELAAARRTMDPRLYRQEFGASFEALVGRVYREFVDKLARGTHDGNVDDTVADDGGTLLVGMDFNVSPMTAVVGQARVVAVRDSAWRHVGNRRELHVLDAIELTDSDTPGMIREIQRRYPRRRVIVCPDASGKSRHTTGLGITDHSLLRDAGFTVDAPTANPLVKDRVANANAMLCDAAGVRRVRIHPSAMALVKALNGITYKDNAPDPKSPHIHITDAFGYLCWQQFNLLDARAWGTSHFPV